MPKLKTVLASVDDLDEALKGLYEQNDHGEFVLQLEDVDSHPTVRGLRTALDNTKTQRERYRNQLAVFQPLIDAVGDEGDLDGTVHDLVGRIGGDGGDDKDFEARLRAKTEALEARYNREKAKVESRAERLEKALHNTLVDSELDAELEKLQIPAPVRPAVRAMMKEKGPKVLELGEGEYKGVFPTDIHGVPEANQAISDYMAEWAKTEGAAAFLPPTGDGGSGAEGTKGAGGGGGKTTYTSQQLQSGSFDLEAVAAGKATVQG